MSVDKYRRMELSTQLIAHRSFAQGASLCHVCLVWFLPTPTTLKAKFSLVPATWSTTFTRNGIHRQIKGGRYGAPAAAQRSKVRIAALESAQENALKCPAPQRSRVPITALERQCPGERAQIASRMALRFESYSSWLIS